MQKRHIQHLYWRSGFGNNHKELLYFKNQKKAKRVDTLFKQHSKFEKLELDLSEFENLRLMSNKKLKETLDRKKLDELRQKSRKKIKVLNIAWLERILNSENFFREKMTLFWANVFVCRDNNNIFHIQQYNNTLRENALGNFGAFVKAIAKEPSMNKYLNNKQNLKRSPNENFARELMELFTLGVGNYTEQDIKESARAFTGWSFDGKGNFRLKKNQHDFGEKTFFGKTGNFNGDAIIDIILEQKQCARFICTKIYKYFVNPIIDEKRLDEITTVFYKDYDIENLMKHIFSSEWFYEDKNIGVKIKSPMELLAGIHNIVPVTFQKKRQLFYLQKMMNQTLLYPNNVSGWKGGKYWIDYNTLMFRMKLPALLLNNTIINLEEKGEFEDDFNTYYERAKKRNKFIKTEKNWDYFFENYGNLQSSELRKILILSKIDKDTAKLLDNLKIASNKNLCIQFMSIPEYQLC